MRALMLAHETGDSHLSVDAILYICPQGRVSVFLCTYMKLLAGIGTRAFSATTTQSRPYCKLRESIVLSHGTLASPAKSQPCKTLHQGFLKQIQHASSGFNFIASAREAVLFSARHG